jgi:hypothetical protein
MASTWKNVKKAQLVSFDLRFIRPDKPEKSIVGFLMGLVTVVQTSGVKPLRLRLRDSPLR